MTRRQLALFVVTTVMLKLLLWVGAVQPAMPGRSLEALGRWIDEAPPGQLAFTLVRGGALLACGYLWLALALQLLAGALRSPRLARVARRALPLALHHALVGGAGLSVAAGALLSGGGRPAAAAGPAVVVLWEGSPPEDPTASMTLLPAPPTPTLTMTALDPGPVGPPPSGIVDPATAEPDPRGAVADSAWQVRPGDSFWSIAREVLVQHGEDRPSDEEIADYWRRLLSANGAQLSSSDHPDLLFPGQIVEVPPP